MIISGEASVMYTFYAPLKASGWFYIGLALVIVGTLVSSSALIGHYAMWRKRNKGQLSPLFAYMTISTLILWIIACIGIVASVLFLFIPWAFGWVDTINVELSRVIILVFRSSISVFLAIACLYCLVCCRSETCWNKGIQ